MIVDETQKGFLALLSELADAEKSADALQDKQRREYQENPRSVVAGTRPQGRGAGEVLKLQKV